MDTGNVTIALAAADELPHLNLADALALLLVLREEPRDALKQKLRRFGIRHMPTFVQQEKVSIHVAAESCGVSRETIRAQLSLQAIRGANV